MGQVKWATQLKESMIHRSHSRTRRRRRKTKTRANKTTSSPMRHQAPKKEGLAQLDRMKNTSWILVTDPRTKASRHLTQKKARRPREAVMSPLEAQVLTKRTARKRKRRRRPRMQRQKTTSLLQMEMEITMINYSEHEIVHEMCFYI